MSNKRPYRQAKDMFPLIEAWQAGEQSQRAFCRTHGLSLAVFSYWLRRFRKERVPAAAAEHAFVSLELERPAPAPEGIRAELTYPDGTRLVFTEPVRADLLRTFLPLG